MDDPMTMPGEETEDEEETGMPDDTGPKGGMEDAVNEGRDEEGEDGEEGYDKE